MKTVDRVEKLEAELAALEIIAISTLLEFHLTNPAGEARILDRVKNFAQTNPGLASCEAARSFLANYRDLTS